MMKFILLIALSVFSLACAQTKTNSTNFPTVLEIRPGEVRWVEFPISGDDSKLNCRNSEVKFVKKGTRGFAFVMESYFSDMTPFKCVILSRNKVTHEVNFSVKQRDYLAEKLKVDSKKIKLSPKDEKRVQEEQVVLNKIYASSIPDFLFTESFFQPLNSVVTSVYGTKRVYNKQKKGQHLGIDYRAAIGDKVPASNAGKIVFSGDLFYTGWTVIIDHGVDIFTVYGHLSKTLVSQGDIVKRGDIIGLSGNTGRTSGPHLHWGTKVQGQYIDGFVLINESKKYFKN
jgi:murein DD-endopeptidase MepM/ murein hydrolase activator NlpD